MAASKVIPPVNESTVNQRDWVESYAVNEVLRDGTEIAVRCVRPTDKAMIQTMMSRLSASSSDMRFLGVRNLTDKDMPYFTDLDLLRHVNLIAEVKQDRETVPIGLAELVLDTDDKSQAEVALTVIDRYQGLRLGRILLYHLTVIARQLGVRRLYALALNDNVPLLRFLQAFQTCIKREDLPEGMMRLTVDL